MQFTLHQLLKAMIDNAASDLHITSNSPPQLRIDGSMVPLKTDKLTPVETKQLCYSILTDAQKMQVRGGPGARPLVRGQGPGPLPRQHLHAARRGGRRLPPDPLPRSARWPSSGVPPVVHELCEKPRGLVLVTGPTGSGKSTTLASMIDKINTRRSASTSSRSRTRSSTCTRTRAAWSTSARSARDTQNFKRALKYILRQDPDVVLIGEMRDLETIEAALTIAETGHLAFATLHTNAAVQTINRIIDVFPPHQQSQIRAQLSFVLEGVICQNLVPRIGGGPGAGVRGA